jgi:hypothetical protein
VLSLFNRESSIRDLAQKPHEPHAAFGHCAKLHAEIKYEVTEKPSQWKDSWIQGQVQPVGEEISFVPQLLCTRREKCGKSEWNWSDGREKVTHRPDTHLDECNTGSQRPEGALNSQKHRGNTAKTL